MVFATYLILLTYFLIGGIAFWFIGRGQRRAAARSNWTKYVTYFVIIHLLFGSIVFNPVAFRYLSLVIVAGGLLEMTRLFRRSGYSRPGFFGLSLLLFAPACAAFLHFGRLERDLILFAFMVVSIFDAFSQISGQLLGRRRLLPLISPGKTVEGLAGGALVALCSALLLQELTAAGPREALMLAAGIAFFAFTGDIAASIYKRTYGVKDFSGVFPGNGGFLDRFDSLIAAAAFVGLLELSGVL